MFPCFWILFIPIRCTFIIIWFFKVAYKTTPPNSGFYIFFCSYIYLTLLICFSLFFSYLSLDLLFCLCVYLLLIFKIYLIFILLYCFPFSTLFLYFIQLLFLILAQVTFISGPTPHCLCHFAFYAVSLIVGFSQLFLYLAYFST